MQRSKWNTLSYIYLFWPRSFKPNTNSESEPETRAIRYKYINIKGNKLKKAKIIQSHKLNCTISTATTGLNSWTWRLLPFCTQHQICRCVLTTRCHSFLSFFFFFLACVCRVCCLLMRTCGQDDRLACETRTLCELRICRMQANATTARCGGSRFMLFFAHLHLLPWIGCLLVFFFWLFF